MPMKLSEGEPSSNIKTTFATLSELIWNVIKTSGVTIKRGITTETQWTSVLQKSVTSMGISEINRYSKTPLLKSSCMILLRVSKIDIRRLNQTAVRPNPRKKLLSPNDERANRSIKNRKKEKAKLMCEPDLSTIRNSNLRMFSIKIH